MTFKHAVVWIDHREAHVIQFNADASDAEVLKTRSKHPHLHHHRDTLASGSASADQHYMHEVVKGVADAGEILIVGPGTAKMELMAHIRAHDPQVAEQVVGVETVDHPTDSQLIAYANKHFVKVAGAQGESV